MADRKAVNPPKWRYLDPYLFIPALLLLGIGLVMVYSASSILAFENYGDSYYFLKRHAISSVIGIVMLLMLQRVDYHVFWKWVYPFLTVILALLILILIPGVGTQVGGAQRWIRIFGFSLQPSEFAKVSVVLFFAYALAKKDRKIRDFTVGFLPIVMVSGVVMILIMASRDLGTVLTIAIVMFLMLYMAGTRVLYLISAAVLSIPFVYHALLSVSFRRQRLLTFLDPWKYPLDSGFQIIQSYVAFHNGGLTGMGLGEGKQKFFYLPAAHTDFIFSVIGEELGWIGVCVIILLFLILIARGFWIFFHEKDRFGLFLSFGLTSLLAVQVIINLGVVMGLLPTKGLALPFVSYGGSSLLANLLVVGILMNISRSQREQGERGA